jgi:hypothetical protein
MRLADAFFFVSVNHKKLYIIKKDLSPNKTSGPNTEWQHANHRQVGTHQNVLKEQLTAGSSCHLVHWLP